MTLHPGGIRRSLDKPPPRQLLLFSPFQEQPGRFYDFLLSFSLLSILESGIILL
ncbi:hypothetical protein ACFPU1_14580 [Thalassorhabdus alkalitolerans]|uniref:Uncharacterized protein n=1 Tax=Thalassorhabdus alkalitolerans TaxID=2282697 RepID=A0ABW0YR87_9BACI